MRTVAIEEFLRLNSAIPAVDVRSPGEFSAGHIPNAHSIPVFTNDERAVVGTLYKQQGKKEAIEKGLELVGPKMLALAKQAEHIAGERELLVHCWRGGMRSNRMAWLFEQLGLTCVVLEGGYKAYRNHILKSFTAPLNLMVLSGPTGTGKTDVLHAMKSLGEQVLDLEGLASHKGSAFGGLGMPAQPSSEQFQNNIFAAMQSLNPQKRIWVESESLTIGRAYLPVTLWNAMNASPSVELIVPKQMRIQHLVNQYGTVDVHLLAESIKKIQQNFGGNRVKESLEMLEVGNLASVADMLLDYYDKRYQFGRTKHARASLVSLESATGEALINAKMILNHINNLNGTTQ